MTRDEATRRLHRRHVEKKSWPVTRNDPKAGPDGYIHYCAGDHEPWPCDVHVAIIEASTLGSSERLAAEKAVIRERGRLYSEVGRLSTFVVPTGVYVDVSDVLSLLDEPLSDPDAERQRAIGEAERARLRREYDERMEMIGAASPPADVSAWDILRWVRDELLVDDPSTALPAAQEPERKF
jgi:hypothetical protein